MRDELDQNLDAAALAGSALLYCEVVNAADGEVRIYKAFPEAEGLLLYTPGELRGKLLDDIIPDQHRDQHRKHLMKYFELPKRRQMGETSMSLEGRRKDGTNVPLEITLIPVYPVIGRFFVIANLCLRRL